MAETKIRVPLKKVIEGIEMATDEWNKFDIHEYSIIERFVYDMPSGRLQDEFERAIDGRGAFRRFKSTLRYYGMEQQWYDFLYEAHREIAIGWCDDNGFEYYEENDK